MGRILRGVVPLVVLAGWLTVAGVGIAETEQATLKRLNDLDRVTGTEAMQGALKTLLDDKKDAKQIIDAALPLAKSKDKKLSYNAALVLGLVTAEMKDMPKSEAFFRVCMEQAAKLQSPRKLLQAYGGLIDLYYDNKKFDEAPAFAKSYWNSKPMTASRASCSPPRPPTSATSTTRKAMPSTRPSGFGQACTAF